MKTNNSKYNNPFDTIIAENEAKKSVEKANKAKHIQEVLYKMDRSMECVMESDPRTLKNPQHEYGWLFETIAEWRKELKGLVDGDEL